jgi:arsenate reductase (thioredoxin)
MTARSTLLFLCQHGGAKSVMAASYFSRIAEQTGLDYAAVAVAAEDPYPAVPVPVVELLERDGFDVRAFVPRQAESDDYVGATRIVSMGCDLAASGLDESRVERWDDVPAASEDLHASAAAIRRHVEALVQELREHR